MSVKKDVDAAIIKIPTPKYEADDIVTTGTVYKVIDRSYDGANRRWTYNLAEVGSDEPTEELEEEAIGQVSTKFLPACDRVMATVDKIRGFLLALEETQHEELEHIEAMQHCKTFDVAAKDLAYSHAAVAHTNSIREWIANGLREIAEILDDGKDNG